MRAMASLTDWLHRVNARLQGVFLVRFATAVGQRFARDNGAMLSAGLAFFMILAFVPMLLIGIAGLGYYFHITHRSGDAILQVQQFLMTQIMPGAAGNEVKDLIMAVDVPGKIQRITDTRGVSGIVGVLGLVWASLQIYLNAAVAMNAAWEAVETRSWLRLRMVALSLLVVSGLFLVFSLVSTAYGSYLAHYGPARAVPGWTLIIEVFTESVATAGGSVMFAVVYRFLPNTYVSWRSAFVGGGTAGVAWEIAKKGLATYLLHPNVSLYGNLANVIIFVLWLYYSMMILLIGAEVSALYGIEWENSRRARLKHAAASVAEAAVRKRNVKTTVGE